MASSSTTKSIILKAADGKQFSIAESIISCSKTIKNMIDDDCVSGVIPLPNVDSRILKKVIAYATKHTDKSVSANELKEFDEAFVEVSTDDLFELLLAANYLNIGSLLDALTEKAADMMRGKTPEQIREIYNIENDFSPEEVAAMNKENAWGPQS